MLKTVTTKPVINLNLCKGCGLCVVFCPRQVFEADAMGKPVVKEQKKCTGCMQCESRCPDFALKLMDKE